MAEEEIKRRIVLCSRRTNEPKGRWDRREAAFTISCICAEQSFCRPLFGLNGIRVTFVCRLGPMYGRVCTPPPPVLSSLLSSIHQRGRQILSRIPASHTTTTTTPWLSEQQLHGHREWESICTQASALCVFIGWIIRLVHSAFILLLLCTAIRFVANTHLHLLPAEREFLHIRKGLLGWSAHNYKTTRHRFAGCSSWRLVFSLIPPFCCWSGALFFISFFFGVGHLHIMHSHVLLLFVTSYVTTRYSIEKGANGFRFECYYSNACMQATYHTNSISTPVADSTHRPFSRFNFTKDFLYRADVFGGSSKVALICKSRRRQDVLVGWILNLSSLARELNGFLVKSI